ncbi:MMPL family transporter [Schlesneria paludicola]|uniref:MMPL family transporter n=1 Tax=Schlesneria paludicola TaxID=360056 RepID=UPI00029A5147|nr:MMPL family transporter [Schlesneria paludicola]
MKNVFDRRDHWGNRFSLWIVVLMAFVAPLCWSSARQLRLENDVEKWLPGQDAELQALNWIHERFPVEERVLVTWEGSSLNDPRIDQVIEHLTGRPDERGIRRGGLPYFSSILEPRHALSVMQADGVEPHEAIRRLEGTLVGAGPLRLRLSETGRSALRKTRREVEMALLSRRGLTANVQDATADLSSMISIPGVPQDDAAAGESIAPAVLTADGKVSENATLDHDLQVSWRGMRIGSESTMAVAKWLTEYIPERGDGKPLVESAFFAPGSPVGLSVGLSEAGLADKTDTVAAIRTACQRAGIPDQAVHLAGSLVTATELNHEVQKAAWDVTVPLFEMHRRSAILMSFLASALVAFALLRNIRLTAMVVMVSLLAMFGATALIPLTGGTMDMILVVMPTLIFVLTTAGAIHVANYWKHAAFHNESVAISQTVKMSWMPGILTSSAVAVGLIALCTSLLTPIKNFGFYGAAGAMLSLSMLMYGLPALLQIWSPSKPREQELDHLGWRGFGQLMTVRSGLQSVAFVAICIGCSLGMNKLQTETKAVRYFPESAEISKDYWFIETNLSGTTPVEAVIRFDQQSQKDTSFLDRMELVRQVQEVIRLHPEVSGTTSLADLQPVSEPLRDDSSYIQKSKYQKRATAVQQRVREGEIPAARAFYTVLEQGRDLPMRRDDKLSQPGDELWRIAAQVNVMSNNDFSVVVADLHRLTQNVLKLEPGSQHSIAGAVPLFAQTQKAVLESLIGSTCLACALILGLFLFRLRSITASLVAMIPTLIPVTVVLGVIGWMEQRIDVGTMITASVGMGIAAQGTVQYLNWVRLAMQSGKSRREAVVEALVHCGPSLWQAGAVVGVGLLVLVPAESLVISRFGGAMAAMVGVALLSDLVLLPQLVAGPLGCVFELTKRTVQIDAVVEEPAPTVADAAIAAIAEEPSVPTPHIKSHGSSMKKRRSSSRRDHEAG